jgi:hypothetical protein
LLFLLLLLLLLLLLFHIVWMAGIESVQYKPEEDIPVIYQAAVETPTQHHLSVVLILVVSYCVLAGI